MRTASFHAATARSSSGSSTSGTSVATLAPRPRPSPPACASSPTTATTVVEVRRAVARTGLLEQPQVHGRPGAELVQIDLDALDAAARREHSRLRLDAR